MRTSYNRRTATKVVGGKTRRKNRQLLTASSGYVIDRRPAGRGYCHVVTKRDLEIFLDLIPEWPEFSEGLERIVLAAGGRSDGTYTFYHREETGAIELPAWKEELWVDLTHSYFNRHRDLFIQFGVRCEPGEDHVSCYFAEPQAKAFLLLHVFMHELGHHCHQRRLKHRSSKGSEDYAENFANRYFEQLFPAYREVFGDPARND